LKEGIVFQKRYAFIGILAICVMMASGLLLSGCGEDSTTNTPSDNNTYLSLPFPSDSVFLDVEQLAVRVTGPDISSPINATHQIDHNQTYAIIELDVPAGANRRITVYGTNEDHDSLYWAAVTVAIASGQRNDVAALLIPINQGVHIYVPYPVDPLFDQVNEMKVTITGQGITSPLITTQVIDHDQVSMVFEIPVPAGANRHFDLVGMNTFDKYLYRAQLTASISDSQNANLSAMLTQLGYGEARRVRVFRNSIPWGFADMDSLLTGMDFSQGPGDNQYQVFNSTLMGSILLVPGRDLVIFEGWQDTAFYNDYMAARDYFEEFIDSGGSVLMIADAGQSHAGYFDSTGMLFPGGVTFASGASNLNRTVTPYHTIVAGMPDSLTGNQVSYGSLGSLPPGAVVLTEDNLGRSTLVVYTFGKGIVAMSSHPLEYLYHHSSTYTTCGSLLSRVVRFILGKDPTPNPKMAG
jgi:hypothetical protein